MVHAVCRQFERGLRQGRSVTVEEAIACAPAAIRRHLLSELLTLELEWHEQQADSLPELSELIDRFPEETEIVHAVFMECSERSTGDLAESGNDAATTGTILRSGSDTNARRTTEAGEKTSEEQASKPTDSTPQRSQESRSRLPLEMPGQFGRYVITECLGQGGMGTVYLAEDSRLGRKVAIKIPRLGESVSASDREAIDRFYREARAMAALRHRNVCHVHDVGSIDGHIYLAMAYVEGEPLSSSLKNGSPFTSRQAAEIIGKVARALHFVHESGVIHRDLKPANIMIASDGEPVIMDFGLARMECPDASEITRTGAVIGSPAYMAPEQVDARHDLVSESTDVYSAGVVLYQMLTGQRPFEGSVGTVLGRILSGPPPRNPSTIADVDPDIEAICLKAMAHRIEDRYTSAQGLADALDRYVQSPSSEVKKTPASSPGIERSQHMQGMPALVRRFATPVTLVILVTCGFWAAVQYQRTGREPIPELPPTTVASQSLANSGAGVRSQPSADASDDRLLPAAFRVQWLDETELPEESLLKGIRDADGVVTGRFAFCLNMPTDSFQKSAEELRPYGYRPVMVRPTRSDSSWNVSAIWHRDGLDWHLEPQLSDQELFQADSVQRQRGMTLTSLNSRTLDNQDNEPWIAVWTRFSDETETEWTIAPSIQGTAERYLMDDPLFAAGWRPVSFHAFNQRGRLGIASTVWQRGLRNWSMTRRMASGASTGDSSGQVVDQCILFIGQNRRTLCVYCDLPGIESRLLYDRTPEQILESSEVLIRQGWYPVSIQRRTPVQGSFPATAGMVWHRVSEQPDSDRQ